MKSLLIIIVSILISSTGLESQLVLYDAPPGTRACSDYELYADGKKVFVYETPAAAFAYFSFNGSVDLKIISTVEIASYDIRPLIKKIKAQAGQHELSFTLSQPCNISVELNKNLRKPIFIFANPPEEDIPDKLSKNTIFYEAGKLHRPGIVRLKSNQTVYIAGGAIVKGSFIADKANHVRIMGRGIVDNSEYSRGEARPLEINRSSRVSVEGIIFSESKHWTCGSYASDHVTYDNIKIVSDNDWDDGIDIVGSRNIRVNNCFIRTKDDCIAIKSGVDYFSSFNTAFTVDSILVEHCVLWNGAWGNGLEIGFETSTDTIRNITFRDCDLVHVEGPEGTFTIHNGDRALVEHVLYENIRVEDPRGYLIDFKILESQYSTDKIRGRINDIRFRNIIVEGTHLPSSVLIGFGKDHLISNVTIEGLAIQGKKIGGMYDGMMTACNAIGVVFK